MARPAGENPRSGWHLTGRVPGDLISWRTRRLVAAGLPESAARRIAQNEDVDLHALLSLIDRGCPPQLAARITAPL